MLKYIQSSHDFFDYQLYNKNVKLERKKLVVFPEKHNDAFWKTLRAFFLQVSQFCYKFECQRNDVNFERILTFAV